MHLTARRPRRPSQTHKSGVFASQNTRDDRPDRRFFVAYQVGFYEDDTTMTLFITITDDKKKQVKKPDTASG
jgi:hypothetical protein